MMRSRLFFVMIALFVLLESCRTDSSVGITSVELSKSISNNTGADSASSNPLILVLLGAVVVVICCYACCCIITVCELANFTMVSLGKTVNLQTDVVQMDFGDYSLTMKKVESGNRKSAKKNSSAAKSSGTASSTKSDKFIDIPTSVVSNRPYRDKTVRGDSSAFGKLSTPPPYKEQNFTSIKRHELLRQQNGLSTSSDTSGMGLQTPPFSNSGEAPNSDNSQKLKNVAVSSIPISPMTAESVSRSTISIPPTPDSLKSTVSVITARSDISADRNIKIHL